jgi:hypothetical protein
VTLYCSGAPSGHTGTWVLLTDPRPSEVVDGTPRWSKKPQQFQLMPTASSRPLANPMARHLNRVNVRVLRVFMFQLVHEYELVVDVSGDVYRPRAYGALQDDLTWGGWLVFFPQNIGASAVVATPRETTQASWEALRNWAAAISPVYLEGALARALELEPEVALAARLRELERVEREAIDQAAIHKSAAAVARRTAELAADQRASTAADLTTVAAEAARRSATLHEEAAAVSRAEADVIEREGLAIETNAAAAKEAHAEAEAAAHQQAARQARARGAAARRARQTAPTGATRSTRSKVRPSAERRGRH